MVGLAKVVFLDILIPCKYLYFHFLSYILYMLATLYNSIIIAIRTVYISVNIYYHLTYVKSLSNDIDMYCIL